MCACSHLFRHWQTEEEKHELENSLEYARSVGDLTGTLIVLTQLLEPCACRAGSPAACSDRKLGGGAGGTVFNSRLVTADEMTWMNAIGAIEVERR